MGEWVVGACINLFGSVAINFGTNLLKLGHTERERSILDSGGTNEKLITKPVMYFHTWRVGALFFAFGNCLNFISFGYAAQSLLAALGSVQFVSNIAFAYFVLNKRITVKVLVATAFIVLGNTFLVAFGNHQSPVYTPGQLAEKYHNIAFLLYCFALILIVAVHHYIYRRGELLFANPGHEPKSYWQLLLPYSYAVVSGAIGSCSVLFAKSLSNLLRLAMSSAYQLHTWFTYSMFLLFLSTAGFWMARLNEGLSLFDAILIVPMFQIVWTLFSICTGFVYFQEYQVFNTLRTTMFILGMISVFIGISLLAPDEAKGRLTSFDSPGIFSHGSDIKDNSTLGLITPTIVSSNESRPTMPLEDAQVDEMKPFLGKLATKAMNFMVKAKSSCLLSLGLGEDSIDASSVLAMPVMSSKMTGFRGGTVQRTKFFPMRSHGWSKIPMNGDDEDGVKLLESSTLHSQGI
ncbi:putative magnesium transporter NIPA8 [Drosera capensis]